MLGTRRPARSRSPHEPDGVRTAKSEKFGIKFKVKILTARLRSALSLSPFTMKSFLLVSLATATVVLASHAAPGHHRRATTNQAVEAKLMKLLLKRMSSLSTRRGSTPRGSEGGGRVERVAELERTSWISLFWLGIRY